MAPRSIARVAVRALPILAASALLAGCGSSSSSTSVALVAYSTPQSAYASLIPAFQATSAGKGISFTQSYGASGDQSRAVLAGQPANVVNFSLAPDVTKLVQAGIVSPSWNAGPTHGFVTDSVVVFIVRKGNPKHITTWDDLVKPGVKVITPNPLSSGSARWNIMAAYGAQLREGKTPAQAIAYLSAVLENTVAQPTSARNALQTFLAGEGDVLLDYESEAIPDQKKGDPIDYVIPSTTLLIQNPIAVVARGGTSASAQAFVNYLISPAGQLLWAKKGYRPVIGSLVDPKQFPTPPGLFTIDSLGGWPTVTKTFFATPNGVVTKIEQGQGVSAG